MAAGNIEMSENITKAGTPFMPPLLYWQHKREKRQIVSSSAPLKSTGKFC